MYVMIIHAFGADRINVAALVVRLPNADRLAREPGGLGRPGPHDDAVRFDDGADDGDEPEAATSAAEVEAVAVAVENL